MKDTFTAINHGKEMITIEGVEDVIMMRPTEIHLKEDGALDDTPSFAILMESSYIPPVVGEISLKMLNDALVTIGYKMVKL
jgi:hypothetical protein